MLSSRRDVEERPVSICIPVLRTVLCEPRCPRLCSDDGFPHEFSVLLLFSINYIQWRMPVRKCPREHCCERSNLCFRKMRGARANINRRSSGTKTNEPAAGEASCPPIGMQLNLVTHALIITVSAHFCTSANDGANCGANALLTGDRARRSAADVYCQANANAACGGAHGHDENSCGDTVSIFIRG